MSVLGSILILAAIVSTMIVIVGWASAHYDARARSLEARVQCADLQLLTAEAELAARESEERRDLLHALAGLEPDLARQLGAMQIERLESAATDTTAA